MILTYWLPTLNVLLSLIAGSLIGYELFRFAKYLTAVERVGKGGMGAMLLLTVAPILANRGAPYLSRAGTPFNVWPSTGLRIAIIILIVGRIIRHCRHERANQAQIEVARDHFERKKA